MKVRFWGTRGSIPVALTSPAIHARLVTVLGEAQGKPSLRPEQALAV